MRRYDDLKCKKRRLRGVYIKNVFFNRITKAEEAFCWREADANVTRQLRVVWVPLDKLKTTQECLHESQLICQLRLHPNRKLPVVIKLKGRGGWYAIWDGNHRATTHVLLGRKRIKCLELRK